ncbi:MAG TPA: ABC transporter permease [Longilinea sp.]|nr:ABC transporter permease [Longilinea sp.]
MKLWSIFKKTLREGLRDWLTLSLSLIFAPGVILLYWMITAGGSTAYHIIIQNQDAGAQTASGEWVSAGESVIEAIQDLSYADGQPIFILDDVEDPAQIETRLQNRRSVLAIIIPAGFTQALLDPGNPSDPLVFTGDLTNPYYSIAAVMASSALDETMREISGQPNPVGFEEIPLGGSAARSEFEMYVPGILVFSIIILVFSTAMFGAREKENGSLRRLQLTRMRPIEYLGGISLYHLLTGIAAMLITLGVALLLGFHSQGSIWLVILIGSLAMLSIIGVGLIIAALSHSVAQAFVIANFPLAIMMFFSGSMFPIPATTLFTIAGQSVSAYDFIPATHAVAAMNKIFTLGVGISGITYEFIALTILSIVYFGIGVWLFQKRSS